MIQLQIVLDFPPGDADNHISVNFLEREDANEIERELAGYIETLLIDLLEEVRSLVVADHMKIVEIRRPS